MFVRHHPKKSKNKEINVNEADAPELLLPLEVLECIFKFLPPKNLYEVSLLSHFFNNFSAVIFNEYREDKTRIFYTLGAPILVGEYSFFYKFGAFKDRDDIRSKELKEAFHGQYHVKKSSSQIEGADHKKEALMRLFKTEKEAKLYADTLCSNGSTKDGKRFVPGIYTVLYLGDTMNLRWRSLKFHREDGDIKYTSANREEELILLSGKIMKLYGHSVLGSIEYNNSDAAHAEEEKGFFSNIMKKI